jgi:hypothetical protein
MGPEPAIDRLTRSEECGPDSIPASASPPAEQSVRQLDRPELSFGAVREAWGTVRPVDLHDGQGYEAGDGC